MALAIDPGLAHCGAFLARLTPGRPEPLTAGVFVSTPGEGHPSEDGALRARFLLRWLREFTPRPDVIVAEAMSYTRNATAAHKVGIAWGVIAAYAEEIGAVILHARPQEVRRGLLGREGTSKGDAALFVRGVLGEGFDRVMAPIAKGQQNHATDAAAVLLAVHGRAATMLANRENVIGKWAAEQRRPPGAPPRKRSPPGAPSEGHPAPPVASPPEGGRNRRTPKASKGRG